MHYKGFGERKKSNEVEAISITPQNQPVPGSNQQKNNAGGFSFVLDPLDQLKRFLILGSEGSTYYCSEQKMTKDNLQNLIALLKGDRGKEAIDLICEISDSGRAAKNEPALFALAFCASCDVHGKTLHKVPRTKTYTLHRKNHEKFFQEFPEENVEKFYQNNRKTMVRRGDVIYVKVASSEKTPDEVFLDDPKDIEIRRYAMANHRRVIRTGTHMLHFLEYVKQFRGWGRVLSSGIADYYNTMPEERLAGQVTKYQQRDGFSQRDVLRLAHPKPDTDTRNTVYNWMVNGWPSVGEEPHPDQAANRIWAYERAKVVSSEKEIVSLILNHRLPREGVPTQWLDKPVIWEALLQTMLPEAMVRNLGNMTKIGLLTPYSDATKLVVSRLADENAIVKARLHPLKLLVALKTYESGTGMKSNWNPVSKIVDALDESFYLAFKAVTPSYKRMMLALDVSGSMGWGDIAGMKGVTPAIGSAAMALVTARIEPNYEIMAFSHELVKVTISPRQRLDDVVRALGRIEMGGTDCSLPMIYALKERIPVDTFIIYTDNETWAGKVHASETLKLYRQQMGIQAKLVVVGMTATKFSIADPKDSGMLDVVGFDSATPEIISGFSRGDF